MKIRRTDAQVLVIVAAILTESWALFIVGMIIASQLEA